MSARTVVIVGASIAGLSLAEGLRARGHGAPILLLGAEPHPPYQRPALSTHVLTGEWTPEQTFLTDRARLAELGIELRTGVTALAVDRERRMLLVAPGPGSAESAEIPFATLVIATGLTPRRHPAVPQGMTVHTLDDILRLRARLLPGRLVAVVGAGVLGCELAAAARAAGCDVVLLARGPSVRIGDIGGAVADRVAGLLRAHGVDIRFDARVAAARGPSDDPVTLELEDGAAVDADVVVVAVGGEPAVDWLRSSGLDLADGVLCDARGRAAADVFAIGDVASWWDPAAGRHVRVPHQSDAIEHAQTVADVLTGIEPSVERHAFFWTELFGIRVQALGRFPDGAATAVVAGDPESDAFVLAVGRDTVSGIVGWNMARDFRLARALVTDSTPLPTERTRA